MESRHKLKLLYVSGIDSLKFEFLETLNLKDAQDLTIEKFNVLPNKDFIENLICR
jgi:hypothetical protein